MLKTYENEECQIMIYEGATGIEEKLLEHVTGYITNRIKMSVKNLMPYASQFFHGHLFSIKFLN